VNRPYGFGIEDRRSGPITEKKIGGGQTTQRWFSGDSNHGPSPIGNSAAHHAMTASRTAAGCSTVRRSMNGKSRAASVVRWCRLRFRVVQTFRFAAITGKADKPCVTPIEETL